MADRPVLRIKVEGASHRRDLSRVLGELLRAIWDGTRLARIETQLADTQARVERYRHLAQVGELESDHTGKAWIDETGRGMDLQTEPAPAAPALQPRREIGRQADEIQRACESEINRMQHIWIGRAHDIIV